MPDEVVYGFGEADAIILKGIAQSHGLKPKGGSSMEAFAIRGGMASWMMEATTTITAASGSTAGSGTAKLLYKPSTTLNAYQPNSVDITATVYNLEAVAISSGERFLVVRTSDGVLWVMNRFGNQRLVRFTLSAALTTSDATKSATITNQYGPGVAATTTTITVHNLATSGGAYVFSGASGAAGLALWDSGTNYRIIQMECP